MARWVTLGYLNFGGGYASSRGPDKRPVNFEFESLKGRDSRYMLEMMNIEKLDDETLFGRESGRSGDGSSPPSCNPADLTRAILQCRAKLAAYCNARDKGEGAQPTRS